MRIRLIAMDMDGTLLDDHMLIPRENRLAIEEAARRGAYIALCSGRLPADLAQFARSTGVRDCAVLALNGADCRLTPDAEPYARRYLSDDALLRCVEVFKRRDASFACYAGNRVVFVNEETRTPTHIWARVHERAGVAYESGWAAMERLAKTGVCKLVYVDDHDPDRLRDVEAELAQVDGVETASAYRFNVEVMPEGVNKGEAVRGLAERLGLKAGNVMTLGDYDNDLSMIRYAGLGVAMGNAQPSVKRAARYVTGDCLEHGVASAIRRFVLDA